VEADDRGLPGPSSNDLPLEPLSLDETVAHVSTNGQHRDGARRRFVGRRVPVLAGRDRDNPSSTLQALPEGGDLDQDDGPQVTRGAYAAVVLERNDDLASTFGKIDSADSPRVALVARKGNRDLSTRLGMRRLQRHLDLSGRDLVLVTRSRSLRVRAREEGVPTAASLRGVNFERRRGGLQLGWVTLGLPTIGAILAVAVFVGMIALGVAVLFWYVPTATITVTVPTEPVAEQIDLVIDTRATEVNVAKGVVPARRREITVVRTLPGPATGVAQTPIEHAAVGITFTNRTTRPVIVPKGSVITAANGMPFTIAADVILAPRVGATGEAIALANRPGTVGNIPPNTARGVDPAFADLVTATNPAPGEKGVDRQYTVVSENDVNFLRNTFAQQYLLDAGKKELLMQFNASETVWGDGAKVDNIDCQPVPPIGQEARYVELTCTAKVSALTSEDRLLYQIYADRLRPKIGSDKALLEDSFKISTDRSGVHDETFDRLTIPARVSAVVAPYVDVRALRSALAGKNRTEAERELRERVPLAGQPVIESPGWNPWLPRKADRIKVTIKANAQ
jgi:hypothetical protein